MVTDSVEGVSCHKLCVWGGGGVLVVTDLVSEGEEWFSGQEQYPSLGLRGLGMGIVV